MNLSPANENLFIILFIFISLKIANFFVPILIEKTSNKYTVRDSFSFCNEIRKQDRSFYMASFDIQSLFINVSLRETIDICLTRISQHKKKIKGMFKGHIKQLLTLTVKSSCFVFNNVYYKQVDGVAMGSQLGPTFSSLFLVYYENMGLDKCPLQFKPIYYRRYVDDIFLMFEKKDHVKKFLNYMNSCHQNIKFTFEEEQNNMIPFLNISMTRVGNELQTSLFWKKTFSFLYLNFNSHLPSEYKKGLLRTLL